MEITLDVSPRDFTVDTSAKDEEIEELAETVYDSIGSDRYKDDFFDHVLDDMSDEKLIEEVKNRGYYVSEAEEE